MGAWSGQEFRCSLVEALCWMSILGCICVASWLHMSTQASICLHGMLPGQHKLFAVLVLNIGIYKPHLVSELDCLIWRVFWSDFHSSEVPGACKAASSVRPPPSHCAGCHAWCPCPQAELGCGHEERREWFVLYALRCSCTGRPLLLLVWQKESAPFFVWQQWNTKPNLSISKLRKQDLKKPGTLRRLA